MEEGLWGDCLPAVPSLACGEVWGSLPHVSPPLTLAVLRLTEALPLLREAAAGPKAGFNPPALPWLMPPNDAAPW